MWVICKDGWWLSRAYKWQVIIRGAFVGTVQSPAAPTNRNTGGGWWVSRSYKSDPFVRAARITSRPCCSICRGGWSLGSRARHCRDGSITSRPCKKFIPLLKIVFLRSDDWLEVSPLDTSWCFSYLLVRTKFQPWAWILFQVSLPVLVVNSL